MSNNQVEKEVQERLIANDGEQLKKLNKKLILPETEHKIQYGRIDILCYEKHWRQDKPIAIELKALNYATSYVIGQLTKYINFAQEQKGQVYFVAPLVKEAIYQELEKHYKNKTLKLFEYSIIPKQGFEFTEMKPKDLDDKREVRWIDDIFEEQKNVYAMSKMLGFKDTKHIRTIYKIKEFFKEEKNIEKNTKKTHIKNPYKRAANASAEIIKNNSNKLSLRFIARGLELYSKL